MCRAPRILFLTWLSRYYTPSSKRERRESTGKRESDCNPSLVFRALPLNKRVSLGHVFAIRSRLSNRRNDSRELTVHKCLFSRIFLPWGYLCSQNPLLKWELTLFRNFLHFFGIYRAVFVRTSSVARLECELFFCSELSHFICSFCMQRSLVLAENGRSWTKIQNVPKCEKSKREKSRGESPSRVPAVLIRLHTASVPLPKWCYPSVVLDFISKMEIGQNRTVDCDQADTCCDDITCIARSRPTDETSIDIFRKQNLFFVSTAGIPCFLDCLSWEKIWQTRTVDCEQDVACFTDNTCIAKQAPTAVLLIDHINKIIVLDAEFRLIMFEQSIPFCEG